MNFVHAGKAGACRSAEDAFVIERQSRGVVAIAHGAAVLDDAKEATWFVCENTPGPAPERAGAGPCHRAIIVYHARWTLVARGSEMKRAVGGDGESTVGDTFFPDHCARDREIVRGGDRAVCENEKAGIGKI